MAAIVSAFHVQLMHLGTQVFFDWVPSKANISDWPTCPDKKHLIPERAEKFDIVLPPMDGEVNPTLYRSYTVLKLVRSVVDAISPRLRCLVVCSSQWL